MLKVVVPFSKWLRGEGSSVSRLHRPSDGKRCCLGQAEIAAGATVNEIFDISSPSLMTNNRIPALMVGRDLYMQTSQICFNLMRANDTKNTSDEQKVKDITALGVKAGIEFEFDPQN